MIDSTLSFSYLASPLSHISTPCSCVSIRYDGDDNANPPTSIPAAIPSSAQPDELDPGDADIVTDGMATFEPSEPVEQQSREENGTNGAQNGNSAGHWDDGQNNDFGAMSVDHGSHGTGIKEDG